MTHYEYILGTDAYINALCDWIDEQWGLSRLWPGYVNDPVDVDRGGCWV